MKYFIIALLFVSQQLTAQTANKTLEEVRGIWSGNIISKDLGNVDVTFNIIVGVPSKDSSVGISGRYYVNGNKTDKKQFSGIVRVRKDTTASIEIKTLDKSDQYAGKFSLIKTGPKTIVGEWQSDKSPANAEIELRKQ